MADLLARPPAGGLEPNSTYYNWAAALNSDWKQLARRVAPDVFQNPQRYVSAVSKERGLPA